MKHTIFFILLSLFVSTQVHAWVIKSDFEGGAPGKLADVTTDPSGADFAFKNTTFSTDNPHSGSQSAKATLPAGSFGWGDWGLIYKFRQKAYEGDEIWFRAWVYFPANWDHGAEPHAKGLRLQTFKSDGNPEAYYNIYPSLSYIYILNGPGLTNYWLNGGGSKSDFIFSPQLIGWEALEMYIKFSATKGIYRVWRNGKLLVNDTQSETLGAVGSYAQKASIFTFYSNQSGSPLTQSTFIDDVIITNEPPNNFDTQGNRYIGVGSVKILARPNPPIVSIN